VLVLGEVDAGAPAQQDEELVEVLRGLAAVRCRGSGEILYEFTARAVFGCTGNFMEFSG